MVRCTISTATVKLWLVSTSRCPQVYCNTCNLTSSCSIVVCSGQNGQTFRGRMGAFRKIIKKHAELVCITAPNIIPPMDDKEGNVEEDKNEDQRGWWFSREDDYYRAQDVTQCCKGYEESLDVVKKAFQEQGPFDGVLAFSQGASLLTLVCSLRENDPDLFHFKFAIFVAGFKSRSVPHESLYNSKITIPTLHVFGDTDKVIPKDMSEDILPLYADPVILQHPGGHFVPTSAPQKKVYLEFLDRMIALKT